MINCIEVLNNSIRTFFKLALKITLKNPSRIFWILKIIRVQNKAVKRRLSNEKKKLHIPPFMIISVTEQCNLQCRGCYVRSLKKGVKKEIKIELFKKILSEAEELGISIILIVGGEPLLRKDLLEVMKVFPHIIFPLFTNGLLLDDKTIGIFSRAGNIIPVISIEGYEKNTDSRRGKGIFNSLLKKIKILKERKLFYGISLTMTNRNYQIIIKEQFIKEFIALGCSLFFYIEYIPVQKNTENLLLNEEQREETEKIIAQNRSKYPALFVSFPGGEEEYGGCLAAGRGFVHINAGGDMEPCPFSPYSDINLNKVTLKKALQSKLLKTIRNNSKSLSETKGGCALWEKRAWVKSLIK